jgi:hypothetical protein
MFRVAILDLVPSTCQGSKATKQGLLLSFFKWVDPVRLSFFLPVMQVKLWA